MKIAVIGAGFAGLAACVFARDGGHEVELYDAVGIGGGASGVACGLIHPFLSKGKGKAVRADEALDEALALIRRVDGDVFRPGLGPRGGTVFAKRYCEGLHKLSGVKLHIKKIETLPEADAVILAMGAGMKNFPKSNRRSIPLRMNKGQALHIKRDAEQSILGDGYLAITETPGICHLGSTYEHDEINDIPDMETAKRLILPRAEKYLGGPFDIIGVSAGVRVAPPQGHYPVAKHLHDNVFALTAFGSRGLLYHALLAKEVLSLVESAEWQSCSF